MESDKQVLCHTKRIVTFCERGGFHEQYPLFNATNREENVRWTLEAIHLGLQERQAHMNENILTLAKRKTASLEHENRGRAPPLHPAMADGALQGLGISLLEVNSEFLWPCGVTRSESSHAFMPSCLVDNWTL